MKLLRRRMAHAYPNRITQKPAHQSLPHPNGYPRRSPQPTKNPPHLDGARAPCYNPCHQAAPPSWSPPRTRQSREALFIPSSHQPQSSSLTLVIPHHPGRPNRLVLAVTASTPVSTAVLAACPELVEGTWRLCPGSFAPPRYQERTCR